MKFPHFIPSGLTRWLTVVVSCAVVETAQLMPAAEPLAPRAGDTLLYPSGDAPGAAVAPQSSSSSASGSWVFVAVVGVAAGAVWFWRRRQPLTAGRRRSITIEDTRPLGNRQFLVVASCDGRRFLLGVAAGGIQLLSPLESQDDLDESNQA